MSALRNNAPYRSIRKGRLTVSRDKALAGQHEEEMISFPPPSLPAERTRIIAEAEFTEDMAKTLYFYFDTYAVDGVVQVEVTKAGLWLPHPILGNRQFLGLARLPDNASRQEDKHG